jgi:glycosyltransferase involved in cell wall biosynthesis
LKAIPFDHGSNVPMDEQNFQGSQITGREMGSHRGWRILMYTPQMSNYGGMETHLCLLAALCARSGMEVTLVTTSNSLNDEARQDLLDSGVRFHELPEARGGASAVRKLTWLAATTLRLRKTRWDVIYTNGQSALAPTLWLAGRRRTRIIHHHHTAGDEREQQSWNPLFRRVLSAAPELVACSLATKRELETVLGRSDVRYIPYLTREIERSGNLEDRTYSQDAVLNFGFVGRLVSTKGVEDVCRLSEMTELSGVRWHIHGEGEDYPASFFEKYPNVIYHGRYRSATEYANVLRHLDATVLLSRHSEGLPLTLIEAMAEGLPWIATDRGGTRELAISEKNSIVVPAGASLEEMKLLSMGLAARIRAGMTSRKAQRHAYDERFSPKVVGRAWLEFVRPRLAKPVRRQILLVGNYSRDDQESMQRFARVMFAGLRENACEVEVLVPPVVLGRWGRSSIEGVGKWLAYVDKFVLFPFRLRQRLRELGKDGARAVLVHICDHSNAMYTRYTRGLASVVTCHDLLAVRGARGEPTDCPATAMGGVLQRWIVHGLRRASLVACVSRGTKGDVERVLRTDEIGQRIRLVHMGLNHRYRRLEAGEIKVQLAHLALPKSPYVLHVGSNLRRKNREGVLRIFSRMYPQWTGWLVFAGDPLTSELSALAQSLGVSDRVMVVAKPENAVLEALYNQAISLLFPSRFEGFGWPIIEAQACGCPVVCSDATPLPEVVGDGGLVCPLEDEEAFAAAVLRLTDSAEREAWIRKGLANAAKFTTERMIGDYLNIYEELGTHS